MAQQSKATLESYEIKIRQADLAARTEDFRNLLAQRNPGFSASARDLYDLLLKPAHQQLEGKTDLVIVPDGPLWNLPFQALQSASAHYVIEDQAVSYAPSLTVLREMTKLQARGDRKGSHQHSWLSRIRLLGQRRANPFARRRGTRHLLRCPRLKEK